VGIEPGEGALGGTEVSAQRGQWRDRLAELLEPPHVLVGAGQRAVQVGDLVVVGVEEMADPGDGLRVAAGGEEEHRALRRALGEVLGHGQQRGQAAGLLRPGGEGGHDRDRVVVGLDHDQLTLQLGVRARQEAVDVAGQPLIPVHAGIESHPDGAALPDGLGVLGERQVPQAQALGLVEPEARHVEGHVVVLVAQLAGREVLGADEHAGRGAEHGRVLPAAAGVEVEQHDAAADVAAVEAMEMAVARVDQLARRAALGHGRGAHQIRPHRVERDPANCRLPIADCAEGSAPSSISSQACF